MAFIYFGVKTPDPRLFILATDKNPPGYQRPLLNYKLFPNMYFIILQIASARVVDHDSSITLHSTSFAKISLFSLIFFTIRFWRTFLAQKLTPPRLFWTPLAYSGGQSTVLETYSSLLSTYKISRGTYLLMGSTL